MSAIDVASTKNATVSADPRGNTADTYGADGGFSRIYESIANHPAQKGPAGRDQPDGPPTLPGAEPESIAADKNADDTSPKDGMANRHATGRSMEISFIDNTLTFPPVVPPSADRARAGHVVEGENDPAGVAEMPEDPAADNAPTRNHSVDNTDDLARILGAGDPQVQIATQDQEAASSIRSRRDYATHPPLKQDAEVSQPASVKRVVVLGRETHFAPVDVRASDSRMFTHQTNVPVTDSEQIIDRLPTPAMGIANAADSPTRGFSASGTVGAPVPPVNAVRGGLSTFSTREDAPRNASSVTLATGSLPAIAVEAVQPEAGALVRIADQIVAQARELRAGTSLSPIADVAQSPLHAGGPVRILRLQLQPEELGLVTARLRIVGGVLELRLTADKPQSVDVLQQDRDGLIEALRRAGYKAEIASIEFGRSQSTVPATAPPPNGNGSGHSSSQGFGSEGNGNTPTGFDRSPDRGGAGDGTERHSRPDENVTDAGDTATRRSDEQQAIYL